MVVNRSNCMSDCNIERNTTRCTCTFSCSRKGACCECISYHRKAGELPGCFFPPDAERTGNRSIEYFSTLVRDRNPWW